jgi:hypothetical protein
MSQESRSLLCPLSDEDLKLRSHNLAASVKEREQVEAREEQAVSRIRAVSMKDLDERIESLATVVKARHEARPVHLRMARRRQEGTMKLYRLDTDT